MLAPTSLHASCLQLNSPTCVSHTKTPSVCRHCSATHKLHMRELSHRQVTFRDFKHVSSVVGVDKLMRGCARALQLQLINRLIISKCSTPRPGVDMHAPPTHERCNTCISSNIQTLPPPFPCFVFLYHHTHVCPTRLPHMCCLTVFGVGANPRQPKGKPTGTQWNTSQPEGSPRRPKGAPKGT